MTPPTTTHPETPEPQSTAPGRTVGADEGLREIRATVLNCIGETIPLRRRWVAAIMRRVVEPLTADRDRLVRELAAAESERDRLRRYCSNHRWNIDIDGNDLLVCMGFHEKGERCDRERYVPDTVLTAAKDRIAELEAALKPFAAFAEHMVDAGGWISNEHRASISTWFGPSEFRAARASLTQGGDHGEP